VRGSGTGVIACGFLGEGDFLGKFDKETVQRTLRPGEKHRAAFLVRLAQE
jgi:hypothetical protein